MVAVSTNWRTARLSAADFAMLEFGEKLTLMPSAMTERDLDRLRQVGFSEREIVAITAAAAYRNFIIRVADGLGVELGGRKDYYDPEVLRAFGVTERAVGGTLYADRQRASDDVGDPARPAAPRPAQSPADDRRPCWISVAADAPLANALSLRNLATALRLTPDTLAATLGFATLVDAGWAPLGGRVEAIIGIVVAATLGSSYLAAHHTERLLHTGATVAEVHALTATRDGASLTGRESEAARFSEKLSLAPGTMTRADVEALRAAGLDDPDVVTIVGAVAFANYVGRIAAALGVRPEDPVSEAV